MSASVTVTVRAGETVGAGRRPVAAQRRLRATARTSAQDATRIVVWTCVLATSVQVRAVLPPPPSPRPLPLALALAPFAPFLLFNKFGIYSSNIFILHRLPAPGDASRCDVFPFPSLVVLHLQPLFSSSSSSPPFSALRVLICFVSRPSSSLIPFTGSH